MTRLPPRPGPVRPVQPALTLEELIPNPELAALELLANALNLAVMSLLAQHPNLLGDESGLVRHYDDPLSPIAERLLRATGTIDRLLHRYRAAAAALHADRGHDLPF